MKKKVGRYQKHCQAKEAYYQAELESLRDVFTATLLGYKAKMEEAYHSREQRVSKLMHASFEKNIDKYDNLM